MNNKRTHIVIPQQFVAEIDRLVGRRGRSAFLNQAAGKEILRLRQIKALEGAAKWVKKLRKEYDSRFEKVTAR